MCDFNEDGLLDIYVANYRLQPNFLFVNKGKDSDGKIVFYEESKDRGVEGIPSDLGSDTIYGHTIGCEWADYDNDSDWDLFCANLAHPRMLPQSDISMLYKNSGAPDYNFTDVMKEVGIEYAETHSEPTWGDYDNDGDLDVFITAVYDGVPSFLYKNNGDGTFTNATYETGITILGSWGGGFADIDSDGDLDLFSGADLFLNRGNDNNWLKIMLQGEKANRAAIGAWVEVLAGKLKMRRMISGGKGTGSQSDLTLHFGLAKEEKIDKVTIHWMAGENQVLKDVPVNKTIMVVQDKEFELVVDDVEESDADAVSADGEESDDDLLNSDNDSTQNDDETDDKDSDSDGCGCSLIS